MKRKTGVEFLKRCKYCGKRFLQTESNLFVCLKCLERICRGKNHVSNANKCLLLYGLKLKEYKFLTQACFVCERTEFIVIHHIVPEKKDGANAFENYMGLCQTCHMLIHMRNVPLARLLWCRNKTIPGIKMGLKNAKVFLDVLP